MTPINDKKNQHPSDEKIGQCKVCSEPISLTATKCIQCGSYQDWTRFVLKWSALIVAFFSIAPLWRIANSLHEIAFTPKAAKIEAAITNYDSNSLNIAYTNSGNLDGIITNVNLSVMINGKAQSSDCKIRPTNDNTEIVVSPKNPPSIVPYKAYMSDTECDLIPQGYSYTNCFYFVRIEWIDFKNNTEEIPLKCRCPQ